MRPGRYSVEVESVGRKQEYNNSGIIVPSQSSIINNLFDMKANERQKKPSLSIR
jgi:hypothetical protein